MCRLFGSISLSPSSPGPWLLDDEIPFLRLANADPEALQAEGWGIAWYPPNDPRPRVEKGAQAVYAPQERDRFIEAARSSKGPLVVAHLRKASNPMGLPREQLVALENTQPFLSEEGIFAHNGWIGLPRETMPLLGARRDLLRGLNDSEVLQQLFLFHLDRTGDPLRAYPRAMEALHQVWAAHDRPGKGPHGGLNLLFAWGPRELWAFCHYTGDHGSCLSGLPRPYYEMSYQVEPARVVVVSEPTNRHLERWTPLRNGHYLRVREIGGRLVVVEGNIPGLPPMPAPSPRSKGTVPAPAPS